MYTHRHMHTYTHTITHACTYTRVNKFAHFEPVFGRLGTCSFLHSRQCSSSTECLVCRGRMAHREQAAADTKPITSTHSSAAMYPALFVVQWRAPRVELHLPNVVSKDRWACRERGKGEGRDGLQKKACANVPQANCCRFWSSQTPASELRDDGVRRLRYRA